jgi:AcrR family transcriptional regulator
VDAQKRAAIGQERRSRTRARIIAAAFDLFGSSDGLFIRIEDIAAHAGITRPTFYNHFSGIAQLREAATAELTHDFLLAVKAAIATLPDPRERASAGLRHYLEKAQSDPRWGWSIVNLSAGGVPFGSETYRQAEQTVREGMAAGLMSLGSSAAGRDIVLGTSLAAISAILAGTAGADYPEQIAGAILMGLGVAPTAALQIAARPLPSLAIG